MVPILKRQLRTLRKWVLIFVLSAVGIGLLEVVLERRRAAALEKLKGATREEVIAVFGKPDFEGHGTLRYDTSLPVIFYLWPGAPWDDTLFSFEDGRVEHSYMGQLP